MTNNLSSKKFQKYICKCCDYNTSRKSQYDRHLTTLKHKIRTNSDQVEFLISQWNIVACTDLEELKEHAFYNQSVKCRHHDCLREDDATQTAFIHLTDVYSFQDIIPV